MYSSSKIIATAMVCLWGLRLGGFLFYRILKTGKDKRFDEIRRNIVKMLKDIRDEKIVEALED